jgi:O-antigen/teichoic acid export membrane protein
MKPLLFFRNMGGLVALNLLIKPLWIFGIDRQVQLQLGYATYGRYFALLGLSYVLLFVADAGLSNLLNQRAARQEPLRLRPLLRLKGLLSLLYLFLFLSLGWITGFRELSLLLLIGGIQVVNSFFLFCRALITAQQHYREDAWLSIVDKALMILFCAPLLYGFFGLPFMSLHLFLQLQLGATGLATALALVLIFKKNLLPPSGGEGQPLLRLLLPFASIGLLMAVHYRADGFLLERLSPQGAREAGYYAAAYRLLDAANMVGYLAASFLVPFVGRHHNNMPLLRATVFPLQGALLLLGAGGAAFAWYQGDWIQQALYRFGDSYGALVISFCLAALPGYLLVQVWGSVLTATGRLRTFVLLLLSSVAINLLLNCWLIPGSGALGACWAAIASQWWCGLACRAAAHRQPAFPLTVKEVAGLGGAVLLLLGYFFLTQLAMLNVWLILAGAGLLLTLCLAIYLRKQRPAMINSR